MHLRVSCRLLVFFMVMQENSAAHFRTRPEHIEPERNVGFDANDDAHATLPHFSFAELLMLLDSADCKSPPSNADVISIRD